MKFLTTEKVTEIARECVDSLEFCGLELSGCTVSVSSSVASECKAPYFSVAYICEVSGSTLTQTFSAYSTELECRERIEKALRHCLIDAACKLAVASDNIEQLARLARRAKERIKHVLNVPNDILPVVVQALS